MLDWYVTDLRLGSLEVSIKSGYRDDDEVVPANHDRAVVETYRNGFRVIEREGLSPAYSRRVPPSTSNNSSSRANERLVPWKESWSRSRSEGRVLA